MEDTVELFRYAQYTIALVLLFFTWGLWRLWRGKRGAVRWLLAAWVLLLLVSWRPFSIVLAGTLEWQTSRFNAQPNGEQAIVVLSGGVYTLDPPRPDVITDQHTYARCRNAAWLYHHGWRVPVVLTGGYTADSKNLAATMAEVMVKEGVAPEQIWTESGSTSTYENARMVARLLHPRGIHRILLVTEAYHMPRSQAAFRKAGFDVVASPCFYQNSAFKGTWLDWLFPMPKSIVLCEDVIHEWLGLILYRVRGRL